MNCIVTAGPTFEPLDEVRRLTNFSTGRLGTELANYLTAAGHRVTLLVGEAATWPGKRHVQHVAPFSSTRNLQDRLKALSRKRVDAVFHAAAVSDFAFGKILTRDATGRLHPVKGRKKIPTGGGPLLAELVPTPKIIAQMRRWFPKSRLVGWKFEADGRRLNAIQAARKQIASCSTDACVANGPAYGHGFGLVTGQGVRHLKDQPALFAALAGLLQPAANPAESRP